jgi:hypothetical protein
MHFQQIVTANQILAVFLAKNYALMIAPMQSGKTGTFKLVGCEMLRQNLVDKVVIFSGNREEALKIQNKDNGSFMLSYKSYLQSQGHMITDSEISGMIDKMTVVWGPQLKDFIPSGRILYIWEESHYGQTQKQQVDQFLTRVGIQSTGEAPEGCFVLSVSATPFSEFSDNSHLNQNKAIIRLVPPESYFGVEKMIQADQVHSYSNIKTQFKSVVKRGFRGYGLVRASGKLQAELIPIALAHGCQVIHYDQKNKEEELNAILSRPAVKTIVFIKGMCRMGHVVIKTHVSFAMETSKGKTDTILQGLLGRFCGYDSSGTHVYIKDLVMDELQRFIDMHNGVETTPVRGANLVGFTVKTRTAIIPIRLRRSDEADMANDILMALRDGRMENHNNNRYIEPVIRKICSAKMQPPEQMTEEEKVDADNFKFHADGVRRLAHREAIRQEALNAIRHAFETKSRSFVLGPGYGASGKRDEVVVHQDRTYNYIIVYVPYDTEQVVQVPHTTRREVFCRETSKPEYKGSGGFTCKIKESTRTDPKELEKTLNTCATFARNFGSDFEEYPNRITNNGTDCILLTEEVFGQLETIASKLRANGVILAWKKKGGRKPVGCDNVRLSEISWTFTSMTPSPTPSVLPKLKFETESKPKQLFVSVKSVAEHLLSSQ